MQPGFSAPNTACQPASSISGDPLSANGRLRESLIEAIHTAVGERNFQHWFAGRASVTCQDHSVQIGVGSTFQQAWMQRRFGQTIAQVVKSESPGFQLEWHVDPALGAGATSSGHDDSDNPRLDHTAADGMAAASAADRHPTVADSSIKLCEAVASADTVPAVIRPRQPRPQRDSDHVASASPQPLARAVGTASSSSSYGADRRERRRFASLDAFVSGTCNELALTAARQVAAAPGERLNPLYIHGPVGTGKTHLAEGIYRELRRQHAGIQVLFMTCEGFANQFTHSLRTHSQPGFRQRFRNVDALIVDDIDFLDGKRAIQEEFLHTFQQLASHGRQVIVTAGSHPRLFSAMSDELVTRFLCGMVCRVEAPDLETRRGIVTSRANELSAEIAPDALEYVSRQFVHNVRELEGALNLLQTWHEMTGRRITLQTARQVLADQERDCIRVISIAQIEQAICQFFGVESTDLKSNRRTRSVCQPRMLAMFLARRHTSAAYREIGEFFGGRNHATVVAAERKVEDWLRSAEELRIAGRRWELSDVINSLEQQILAG